MPPSLTINKLKWASLNSSEASYHDVYSYNSAFKFKHSLSIYCKSNVKHCLCVVASSCGWFLQEKTNFFPYNLQLVKHLVRSKPILYLLQQKSRVQDGAWRSMISSVAYRSCRENIKEWVWLFNFSDMPLKQTSFLKY